MCTKTIISQKKIAANVLVVLPHLRWNKPRGFKFRVDLLMPPAFSLLLGPFCRRSGIQGSHIRCLVERKIENDDTLFLASQWRDRSDTERHAVAEKKISPMVRTEERNGLYGRKPKSSNTTQSKRVYLFDFAENFSRKRPSRGGGGSKKFQGGRLFFRVTKKYLQNANLTQTRWQNTKKGFSWVIFLCLYFRFSAKKEAFFYFCWKKGTFYFCWKLEGVKILVCDILGVGAGCVLLFVYSENMTSSRLLGRTEFLLRCLKFSNTSDPKSTLVVGTNMELSCCLSPLQGLVSLVLQCSL